MSNSALCGFGYPGRGAVRDSRWKGELEVRSLIDRGRYVRYNYLHPETGEPMEGGKVRRVLLAGDGTAEEYFVIPTNSRRDLFIPALEEGARKAWNGTKAVDPCPPARGHNAKVLRGAVNNDSL